jgi:proteasome accessory factor B
MSGLQPLERQWTILRTLAARRYGATVGELAEEHGVSKKTIRRDLALLRDLGFRVSPRQGARGCNHWVAAVDSAAPPLTFDISEILALYLGRALLEPLAGTAFWDSTQSAFRKIKATLAEAAVAYLDKLSGLIHRTSFRDSNYREKSQLIDDLMVSIEDCRITFITYQSARSTEPLTYDVYPYGVVYHHGSLYLVAHSQQHDEIRTFKVDRIVDVTLEQLKFQKPTDFNLRDYLRHSLAIFHEDGPPQRVVIRFAPEVARYVAEHRWHASQTLTRQDDDSLLAEFELTSLEEVKSWVLSFGSKAVVEEPPQLRETIEADLHAALGAYAHRLRVPKLQPAPDREKR